MKVKIKIITLGHFQYRNQIEELKSWKSDLFEIVSIGNCNIAAEADGLYWEYLDVTMEQEIPDRDGADILVAVTNVPIEDNYFARRYSRNRVCVSYSGMTEILNYDNIPVENLVLRVLYSIVFVYRRFGNRIPLTNENSSFTHDDTRGCIFDMDGIKSDIIYSTYRPQLCPACIHALTNNAIAANRIENNLINKVQKELLKIDKGLYFKISDWIKRYPICTLFISSFVAIALNVIASFIYEKMK